LDCNPKWNPDIIADWNNLREFEDNSFDFVVSHHSLEHVGCGDGDGFLHEAHRILKDRGSLIVIVPDMKVISYRYAHGLINEETFNFLTYGAYMDHEADRHKWSYSPQALVDYLKRCAAWYDVHTFNWRDIPGADIAAKDWWFYGIEAIK
jgi:predicted SAM-dependent methyltransferase